MLIWPNCSFGMSTVSHFWHSLWKMVNTWLDLSNTYHPKMDGKLKLSAAHRVTYCITSLWTILKNRTWNWVRQSLLKTVLQIIAWGSALFKWCIRHFLMDPWIWFPEQWRSNKVEGRWHCDKFTRQLNHYKCVLHAACWPVPTPCWTWRRWFCLECFSVENYNKLKAKNIGPIEIFKKLNLIGYQLQLSNSWYLLWWFLKRWNFEDEFCKNLVGMMLGVLRS